MRKALWSMAFLGYTAFAVGCGEPAAKKVEPAPPAAADGHTHAPGEAHDHDHDHDHAHDEKAAAPTTSEPAAPAAGDTVPAPEPAVTDPLAPAAESEAPPAPEKAPQ